MNAKTKLKNWIKSHLDKVALAETALDVFGGSKEGRKKLDYAKTLLQSCKAESEKENPDLEMLKIYVTELYEMFNEPNNKNTNP